MSPSGFRTCEAIFAKCSVRATPIDIGKPSSARTRARTVRAAFVEGQGAWFLRGVMTTPLRARAEWNVGLVLEFQGLRARGIGSMIGGTPV
jgi:hypothetical protein